MRLMMRVVRQVLVVSAGMGMAMAAHVSWAQGSCTFTDESGKTVTWPNCQPPADTKSPPPNGVTPPGTTPAPGTSPAKSFPYPGDTPAASPSSPNAPAGQSSGGSAPAAAGGGAQSASPNQGSNPGQGAASKFPFPGEDSSGSAAKPGGLKNAGSSGSSSSSSSSGSSGIPGEGDDPAAGPLGEDPDPAAKAAEARREARKKKGIDFHQTSDERESEDVKIAQYYQNDGDYKGAYERATDAVSLADDDAEAHLALADAARRLGKLDEAEKNYKKCLALDPVPKTKRAAEKALKEMAGG